MEMFCLLYRTELCLVSSCLNELFQIAYRVAFKIILFFFSFSIISRIPISTKFSCQLWHIYRSERTNMRHFLFFIFVCTERKWKKKKNVVFFFRSKEKKKKNTHRNVFTLSNLDFLFIYQNNYINEFTSIFNIFFISIIDEIYFRRKTLVMNHFLLLYVLNNSKNERDTLISGEIFLFYRTSCVRFFSSLFFIYLDIWLRNHNTKNVLYWNEIIVRLEILERISFDYHLIIYSKYWFQRLD
jgi:hypothetical protein